MDEINLELAELFADSARGVYIPQFFAESVRRDLVTGVDQEQWDILESGPDHELYWDVWCEVTDGATLHHPNLGECYLYQDGDLWIVPQEIAC